MSWLSRLFRRSAQQPETSGPMQLLYIEAKSSFDTLDEIAKQASMEQSLVAGILELPRNSGRYFDEWRSAVWDLKRRGLYTDAPAQLNLIERLTHEHRIALDWQEQMQWHVEGRPWYEEFKSNLDDTTRSVANIEACLRYLKYLARRRPVVQARWEQRRLERRTGPAKAQSRLTGRL